MNRLDATRAAQRLECELGTRTRTLLAAEMTGMGLPSDLLDTETAALVMAAGYAALIGLLAERDLDGSALWTLAGPEHASAAA